MIEAAFVKHRPDDELAFARGADALVADLEQLDRDLAVAFAAIEGEPPCPPGYHIFVGSKAPWHEIGDDLAQHDTWPPE